MKWLDKLMDFAPDIASAVISGGATLPAIAIKSVAEALGKDIHDIDTLSPAITHASDEQMIQVQQANSDFKFKMRQLGNDLVIAELTDRQQARQIHQNSKMPATICILLTILVAVGAYLLFTMRLPEHNDEIAYLLFGTVLAKWGDTIAYWIGSTKASSEQQQGKTH